MPKRRGIKHDSQKKDDQRIPSLNLLTIIDMEKIFLRKIKYFHNPNASQRFYHVSKDHMGRWSKRTRTLECNDTV